MSPLHPHNAVGLLSLDSCDRNISYEDFHYHQRYCPAGNPRRSTHALTAIASSNSSFATTTSIAGKILFVFGRAYPRRGTPTGENTTSQTVGNRHCRVGDTFLILSTGSDISVFARPLVRLTVTLVVKFK